MPSPLMTWSQSMSRSTPSIAAPWPPSTTTAPGACSRTRRAISRALTKFGAMNEIPTMS